MTSSNRRDNPWQQFAQDPFPPAPGFLADAGQPMLPPQQARPPASAGHIIATIAAIAFILSGLVVGGFMIFSNSASRGDQSPPVVTQDLAASPPFTSAPDDHEHPTPTIGRIPHDVPDGAGLPETSPT